MGGGDFPQQTVEVVKEIVVNLPESDNKALIITAIIGGIFALLAAIIPIMLRKGKNADRS